MSPSLLDLLRRAGRQAAGESGPGAADKITWEVVDEALPNGRYLVLGRELPTTGEVRGLRKGAKVPVAWVRGVPTAILGHQWRRAQFHPHPVDIGEFDAVGTARGLGGTDRQYLVLSSVTRGVLAVDLTDLGCPLASQTTGHPVARFVDGGPGHVVVHWCPSTGPGADVMTFLTLAYGGPDGEQTVSVQGVTVPKLAITEVERLQFPRADIVLRTVDLSLTVKKTRVRHALSGQCTITDGGSIAFDSTAVDITATHVFTHPTVRYGVKRDEPQMYARQEPDGTRSIFLFCSDEALDAIDFAALNGSPYRDDVVTQEDWLNSDFPSTAYTTFDDDQGGVGSIIEAVFRFPRLYVVNATTRAVLLRSVEAATSIAWDVYACDDGEQNSSITVYKADGVTEWGCGLRNLTGGTGGVWYIWPFEPFTWFNPVDAVSEQQYQNSDMGPGGTPMHGLVFTSLPNPYLLEPWKSEFAVSAQTIYRRRRARGKVAANGIGVSALECQGAGTGTATFPASDVFGSEFTSVYEAVPRFTRRPIVTQVVTSARDAGGLWADPGVYRYRITVASPSLGLAENGGREFSVRVDEPTKTVTLRWTAGGAVHRVYRSPDGVAWSLLFTSTSSPRVFTDDGSLGPGGSPPLLGSVDTLGALPDHRLSARNSWYLSQVPRFGANAAVPIFVFNTQVSGEPKGRANEWVPSVLPAGGLEQVGALENTPNYLSVGWRHILARELTYPDRLALIDRQARTQQPVSQASVDALLQTVPLTEIEFLSARNRVYYAGGQASGKKALLAFRAGTAEASAARTQEVQPPQSALFPLVTADTVYQTGRVLPASLDPRSLPA